MFAAEAPWRVLSSGRGSCNEALQSPDCSGKQKGSVSTMHSASSTSLSNGNSKAPWVPKAISLGACELNFLEVQSFYFEQYTYLKIGSVIFCFGSWELK
jgi:hypothetical protein